MSLSVLIDPFASFWNDSGSALASTIEVYDAGGAQLSTIYTTSTGDIESANPLSLVGGRATIFAKDGAGYKVILKSNTGDVLKTLDNLYTIQNYIRYFDTVADMVADKTLSIGMIVETAGRITKGDGGDNRYLIVTATTGTDDGGKWIDLDTLQAKGLFPNGKITALHFGAIEGGVVDASTAFQAQLDYIISLGNSSYELPDGKFLLNTQLSATTSLLGMKVIGQGVEATQFIVPSSNTTGAFALTFTDRASIVTLLDFTIYADGPGVGTAIFINQPEGGNRHNRTVYMHRVEIKPIDITTDYFKQGIDLTGCWRPLIDGVIVGGPYGPGISDDYADASAQYSSDIGMNLNDCYAPEIINSYVWSANVGIKCITLSGTEEESFRMTNTNIVGVRTALIYTRTGQEPTLWIENCHTNWRDVGLNIDGCKLIKITGLVSYQQDSGSIYTGVPTDILLDNTSLIIIDHNLFHFTGATDRRNIELVGSTASDQTLISENIFNATADIAISVGSGATNVFISNNEYPGIIATTINDASGVATIIERNGSNNIQIESQADTAPAGPELELFRNSASPAVADSVGTVIYSGNNSAGTKKNYVQYKAVTSNVTDTTEGATFQLFLIDGGTLTKEIEIQAGPGSAQTGLFLYVNDGAVTSLRRVTVGATDSGGSGFRYLRVPN